MLKIVAYIKKLFYFYNVNYNRMPMYIPKNVKKLKEKLEFMEFMIYFCALNGV